MKLLLGLLLFAISAQGFDHSSLDAILKEHVDAKGMVDYEAILKDRETLDLYLESTGSVSKEQFSSWSESERLAFLINVYNAETLQLIIDHYPVTSIKKIGGLLSSPWKKDTVTLFGKKISLDDLEHGIIRVDYAEPRIHFAVVCAAIGCPPLRPGAFTGAKLESQLDEQTRQFLQDREKNRVEDGRLHLSPIFDWYEGDFVSEENTVADYVNPYLEEDTKGMKISYTDYDWDLNKQ